MIFIKNNICKYTYLKMGSAVAENPPPQLITTIEWEMMDKSKFFPLSMLSSFSVRCMLYPLTLIKTQLQVQRRREAYKGMLDAATKIHRHEGFFGLYRGFWLSSPQIVSGVFYISTYEGVRHILGTKEINSQIKALVAGGCASLVSQTIIVPFDVLSQHLMVLGLVTGKEGHTVGLNPLGIRIVPKQSRLRLTLDIARTIYQQDGFRGYYRGYLASLAAYVPNSALWWAFYHYYQDYLLTVCPEWMSHLLIQCVAGTFGGFTTTILTNPLDIVRARLQVQRLDSMRVAFASLWEEEGMRGLLAKGLSARLVQSASFSFSIILGYETIKRVAVTDQYKVHVRW